MIKVKNSNEFKMNKIQIEELAKLNNFVEQLLYDLDQGLIATTIRLSDFVLRIPVGNSSTSDLRTFFDILEVYGTYIAMNSSSSITFHDNPSSPLVSTSYLLINCDSYDFRDVGDNLASPQNNWNNHKPTLEDQRVRSVDLIGELRVGIDEFVESVRSLDRQSQHFDFKEMVQAGLKMQAIVY